MRVFRLSCLLFCLLIYCPMTCRSIPLDTLLTRWYDKAASLMADGAYDSAQYYFDRAFATKGAKESPVYPILLNEQATLLVYRGNLPAALETKKKVLPYLPQVKNLETHVSVYNDLGILYHRHNMQDSAIYYYNKALDAAVKYGDASWLANLSLNLGVFHFNLKHYPEAEKFIDQALQYVQQTNDTLTTFNIWQVRAGIKAQINKTEEAGFSARKAWQIASSPQENPEWQLRCISSLYRYFQRTHQNDSITYYIQKGNELLKKVSIHSIPAIGFIQVRSTAYYESRQYAKALKDLIYLNTTPSGTEKKSLFEKMAVCYQHTGQPEKAFLYMDSARMWTDSLAKEQLTKQIAEFNVKYQTQEKELEIAQLQHKVLRSKMHLPTICIILVLLLMGIVLIILTQRQKRKMAERKLQQIEQEKKLESAKRFIDGLEEECKYFAKELHDGIANDLLALQMKTEMEGHKELSASVGELRKNVRTISHKLMPPVFDHVGLDDLLEQMTRNLAESFKVTISYTTDGHLQTETHALLPDIAHNVYRIVQEITMNILQHAQATEIHVGFSWLADTKNYLLTITDNGQQATAPLPATGIRGIGLHTIADRVKIIHGSTRQYRDDDKHENIFELTFQPK